MATYNKYPRLFAPIQINGVVLRNRVIATAATPHHMEGPEEYPNDRIIEYFARIAKGGAAVVTCNAARPSGRTPVTVRFPYFNYQEPRHQNYFSLMADAIHRYGAKASYTLTCPERPGYDVCDGARSMVVAGSGRAEQIGKEMPVEMIHEVIEEQARNCVLLKEMGFDMVYIHCSYQFFMQSRFLSPLTNKRTDEFGGSIENRARFLLMMCQRIKELCGKNFLIEVSVSGEEPQGGITKEDIVRLTQLAEGLIDILQIRGPEIDTSLAVYLMDGETPWAYLPEYIHKEVKKNGTKILIEAVSGFTRPDLMEDALEQDKCDIIGTARGWISNPDLMLKAYDGADDDIVPCLRCNKCHSASSNFPFVTVCSVNPAHCVSEYVDPVDPKHRPTHLKRIAVIGGGPGGMKAAITAAQRGHSVTIFEQSDRLGGALNHSDFVSFKWPLRDFRDYLIRQVSKLDIPVHLNTRCTPETLKEYGFDEVIVAIGAQPVIPPIPGIKGANVRTAISTFGHEDELAQSVAIIGGGEVGVELAIHLARTGRSVTILDQAPTLAKDAAPIHFRSILEATWKAEKTLTTILNATVTEVTGTGLYYTDADGSSHFVETESIINAAGSRSKTEEALCFFGTAGRTHMIGDCNKVGSVQSAMRDAYYIALQI